MRKEVAFGSASPIGFKGWLAVVCSEGSVRQISSDQLKLFDSLLSGLYLNPI